MMKPEAWVSLEEIAQHLAVSQDTVHRWIRNRGLPAHKVGRIWRFKVSQVDAWVQEGNAKEDGDTNE
jgi:excisionase family DNA binding protein